MRWFQVARMYDASIVVLFRTGSTLVESTLLFVEFSTVCLTLGLRLELSTFEFGFLELICAQVCSGTYTRISLKSFVASKIY